jgi:phage gp36-like protein
LLWCATPTHQPTSDQAALGILDADSATLDHLLPARLRRAFDHTLAVLACYACNQLRARLDAYARKAWPLTESQLDRFMNAHSAYRARIVASTLLLRVAPGATQIASEWDSTQRHLTSMPAVPESALPTLSDFEIQDLKVRLCSQSALPALL